MWVFKTYKTLYREDDLKFMESLEMSPLATNAVKRRINNLNRPFDLSLHEDRQLIGYNYLDYVK